MIKNLTLLILSLLFFQTAKAQKDTVLLYMKNSGAIADTKDSADYFRLILPPDTIMDRILYPVHDFYLNGKAKKNGTAIVRSKAPLVLTFQGPCTTFYPNGNRQSNIIYDDHGQEVGNVVRFYPNGKLYCYTAHFFTDKLLLIECRDSTGKILAENGKGNWIKLDENTLKFESEGPVVDSLENGIWHGNFDDSSKYDCLFEKGIGKSGVGYDKYGHAHPFTQMRVNPAFEKGVPDFIKYLSGEIHYPDADRKNDVQGRVIVTFIVEKDGSVSDVKVLRSPDKTLADEALRVVSASPPWHPGLEYGLPVRVQYTVPIAFSLNDAYRKNQFNTDNNN